MTRFILIDSTAQKARVAMFEELKDAQRELGLGNVDHGTWGRGIAYVVDEFGLFVPKEQQHYAKFGNTLIAGNCVMYAYNEMGETIDIHPDIADGVSFFESIAAIEHAITRGLIRRPQIIATRETHTDLVWSWPDPAPKGMMR